ncbi:FAD/NAD(P)-binding domain-containing protein [Gymnopus androsaceus JB14]|uniref:FAD/NAD(P)-binding domain-containing protein n=1 Tax=Gymnopus androsaceus JB14 TaxID=1447944 RepID=A0A6A4GW71_9AGAR|nr:FAD/NAD(P)-binding domain-containing protein [Gymnopus androsaceus JB14]
MKKLDVVVVGAGIGGLSTALALAADGHHVTVLDAVKAFTEVGAGIRVPPNSSKLALEWGVDFDSIKKETSLGNRFLNYKNEILCDVPFQGGDSDVHLKYGAPYYFIHRADLVDALVKATKKYSDGSQPENAGKIRILTSRRVVEYDYDKPAVRVKMEEGAEGIEATPEDLAGYWYTGDLVISAEGIKSLARSDINGSPVEPVDTGDVAYRILVPAKPMLEDPELETLVTEAWARHWMGPEGHAVGYPLRGGELFNIIIDITHRTDRGEPVSQGTWKNHVDNRELVERFGKDSGWCSQVQKLCAMTSEFVKWKLVELEEPLRRWVHPSGKVALLGDACHPMMPYLAQGAAQVMEDAAALRAALSLCNEIPDALALYEKCRVPRTDYVTRNTQVLQEWLHLYDGPAQEQRDSLMKLDTEDNPIFWASEVRKDWLFGYDARRIELETRQDVPRLPPLPSPEASVYPGKELGRKLAGKGYGYSNSDI